MDPETSQYYSDVFHRGLEIFIFIIFIMFLLLLLTWIWLANKWRLERLFDDKRDKRKDRQRMNKKMQKIRIAGEYDCQEKANVFECYRESSGVPSDVDNLSRSTRVSLPTMSSRRNSTSIQSRRNATINDFSIASSQTDDSKRNDVHTPALRIDEFQNRPPSPDESFHSLPSDEQGTKDVAIAVDAVTKSEVHKGDRVVIPKNASWTNLKRNQSKRKEVRVTIENRQIDDQEVEIRQKVENLNFKKFSLPYDETSLAKRINESQTESEMAITLWNPKQAFPV